jgi:hypothetical protein
VVHALIVLQMKLQIPGQLKGGDAGRVMPVAIRLRMELEPSFADLGDERLHLITPILRVGGEAGSFGEDNLENVKIAKGEAECDVVIGVRDWRSMDEAQIYAVIKPRVIEALRLMLTRCGCDSLPAPILQEFN